MKDNVMKDNVMKDWKHLGAAFANLGDILATECESMEVNCEANVYFEELYTNYVQLLETIKIQRKVIGNRFDKLDELMCVLRDEKEKGV